MSPNCPTCEREVPWYGNGDRAAVPCVHCQVDLPLADVSRSDLWKAALGTRYLTVIRRRQISSALVGKRLIPQALWNLTWITVRNVDGKWEKLRFVERLFVDDYGNVSIPPESIWAQANVADFKFQYDRSWTGSF